MVCTLVRSKFGAIACTSLEGGYTYALQFNDFYNLKIREVRGMAIPKPIPIMKPAVRPRFFEP